MKLWILLNIVLSTLVKRHVTAFSSISKRWTIPQAKYAHSYHTLIQSQVILARRGKNNLLSVQDDRENDWETDEGVETDNENSRSNIEKFLKQEFPEFYYLMCKNDEILQTVLRDTGTPTDATTSSNGVTLFVPNAQAFEKLGSTALRQLEDERNIEIVQKIAAYHVVKNSAIDYRKLRTEDWTKGRPKDGSKPAFTVQGIQTMGGVVPVGRSKIDQGWFGTGWFAKADGDDPVVGPSNAKILESIVMGSKQPGARKFIVHVMNGFVSPTLLWRYMDQLQIKLPGL